MGGFLLWLEEVLGEHTGALPDGQDLLDAARAMIEMIQIWMNAPPVLAASQIQASFDAWSIYHQRTDKIKEITIPERHLTTHLLRGMRLLGNPERFANWADEGVNRTFRCAARFASQKTFEVSVMRKMRQLLKPQDLKATILGPRRRRLR